MGKLGFAQEFVNGARGPCAAKLLSLQVQLENVDILRLGFVCAENPGGCSDPLDHAVVVVGLGTTEDGQDYWLVKNSWGVRWGEQGFFKCVLSSIQDPPSATASDWQSLSSLRTFAPCAHMTHAAAQDSYRLSKHLRICMFSS